MQKKFDLTFNDPKSGQSYHVRELFSDYRELAELEHLCNAAIRQLTIKFEILNDEFKVKYRCSPIHHN